MFIFFDGDYLKKISKTEHDIKSSKLKNKFDHKEPSKSRK